MWFKRNKLISILTLSLVGMWFVACSDNSDDKAETAAKTDEDRPVDDIEQIPGYLVDPTTVAIAKDSSSISSDPGTVKSGTGSPTKNLYVKIWRWPNPGQSIAQTNTTHTIAVEPLGSALVNEDGSFEIAVSFEPDDTLVCAFSTNADPDTTIPVRQIASGVLEPGNAAIVVKRLAIDETWVGLTFETVADFGVP